MDIFEEIFRKAEHNEMLFLTSEFSFEKTKIDVGGFGSQYLFGSVTYKEKRSLYKSNAHRKFVILSIAPYRLEADLFIGYGKDEFNTYSIAELYSLECGNPFPNRKYNLYDSTKDFEILKCIIEELTSILKSYGNRFFSSDTSLWEDLKNQRANEFSIIDDSIKSKNAAKAFKEKDWESFITSIESKKSKLSELEKKRLQYAKKQL
jgi:hypothetical protein